MDYSSQYDDTRGFDEPFDPASVGDGDDDDEDVGATRTPATMMPTPVPTMMPKQRSLLDRLGMTLVEFIVLCVFVTMFIVMFFMTAAYMFRRQRARMYALQNPLQS
jgi:hypothetical protein